MDPFSLIFGIAGLVGLAQVVVEKGFSYIGTASGARDDIRTLISEVAVYGHIPHSNRYLRLISECRLSAVLSSLVPVVDALELSGGGTGLFAIHISITGLPENLLMELFASGITKHRQIADCEEILQQLHDILQKVNPTSKADVSTIAPVKKRSVLRTIKESVNNAGKIAAWPLNKDETKGLLDRLQAHKTTFILTLSADSTSVSHPWSFCYCGLKYVLLAPKLWIYWTKRR